MTAMITAVVGSQIVGGLIANDSAGDAADAQVNASNAEIAERRRQFDAIQKLLEPYVQAGPRALTAQQSLMGLSGVKAQREAIAGIQSSPEFGALVQQGENAILQNASATGNLRGGNVQGALAQFRPQILSQLIERQFARLGGMTQLGQNSAVGVGNAGMQTANGIGGALQSIGAAQAGGQLAQGQALTGIVNGAASGMGLWSAMQPGYTLSAPAYTSGGITGSAVLPNILRGGF